MPKRLAVVGLGGWATSMHLPVCRGLKHEGRALYAGWCDHDLSKARAIAAELGGTPYADLQAMLAAERPDGLVVLVKPDVTPELLRQAIAACVPFLTEKPPTPTVAVHRELRTAAGHLPHVIGYNRRFSPYMTAARAWLNGHAVQCVSACMLRHKRMEADFTGTAVHALDAALYLAGDAPVRARIETIRRDGVRNLYLTAWTRTGGRIQVTVAPNAACTDEYYEAWAAQRAARVEHPQGQPHAGRARLYEANALSRELFPADFGLDPADAPGVSGIHEEHAHFLEVLEGRAASRCTLADTFLTQVLRQAFAERLQHEDQGERELNLEDAS